MTQHCRNFDTYMINLIFINFSFTKLAVTRREIQKLNAIFNLLI